MSCNIFGETLTGTLEGFLAQKRYDVTPNLIEASLKDSLVKGVGVAAPLRYRLWYCEADFLHCRADNLPRLRLLRVGQLNQNKVNHRLNHPFPLSPGLCSEAWQMPL